MKKVINLILIILLIAIIVVSSICLYKELNERKIQNEEYENLAELFENISDDDENQFIDENESEAEFII